MYIYVILSYVTLCWIILYYIAYNNYYIPVVPHKAVAEVSKIGNL